MDKEIPGDTICKSIFKSGEFTISKEQFTKKWIAFINHIEKNKSNIL